ncbi:hypothetical protein MLD38_027624 [Melastoma candidum]|uniref:Uncharacterized protein n=1 Tax=Melastoma candidum TaxID=119954 RepID=A0ACB9P6U1_9MYRT|nr:hypothetical protein MLD38_027624 [Melastoma candidum]
MGRSGSPIISARKLSPNPKPLQASRSFRNFLKFPAFLLVVRGASREITTSSYQLGFSYYPGGGNGRRPGSRLGRAPSAPGLLQAPPYTLHHFLRDPPVGTVVCLACCSNPVPIVTAKFAAAQAPAPIVTAKVAAVVPGVSYTTLGSFSWDQDCDKVKIYISLEGVDQEKIEADFKLMSVDIRIHDVNGKNYRCAIPKLNKEIVPDKCKVLVKPTRIVVTLVKALKGNWLDLHFKEEKLKPGLDKEKDPMAGIMDLMKNMYEGGDDQMKRTIAKAWTDARSGKTATNPLKGYR